MSSDLTMVRRRPAPRSGRPRRSRVVAVLTALMMVGGLRAADAIPDEDCLLCHSDPDMTKTDADGNEVSVFVDEAIFAASAHGTNTCFSCHDDITSDHPDDGVIPKRIDCATCHEDQSESYGASVHGLALAAGDTAAATCVDCHGDHNVTHPTSLESPLHWSRLAETCGECHPDAADDVAASVHGMAMQDGRREAPTCTDCHAEHRIEALNAVSSVKLAEQICAKCHASERINTKFKMPARQVESFFDSYHGLAARMGDTHAANCASCHGYHKILPSTDPDSSISPNHLVETCGQCHPGATENFALGRVHLDLDLSSGSSDGIGTTVNRWVRAIYLAMIFVVVGMMTLHSFLSWLHRALAAKRSSDRVVPRMDQTQRVQHFILLSSFILLALTGFALKFPDSWLALMFGADEAIRRWLHRFAGVVLLALGFYHILYVLFTARGRRLVRDLAPARHDLGQLARNTQYLVGRAPKPPKFARFGYIEKVEYWAVVWGTIIMGVTGLMIWLKMPVTQWLPRWAVDVATTVHYYEAILACLSIVVWHFYHVILAPGTYPMNWAWWDGKVTREWYEEEHGLDTETLAAASEPAAPAKPEGPGARKPGDESSG
ncbi:MAG: cytochrome b/b6 domain-containing protein [Verrucomicrobiales bacterium]|nr:cytochrome b/b6 domain-containing protein [Verrucomicrobiales bacterium]MCP5525967.1 cytochrome b/b6 domain-containing protein [Verrucomicrobiales bacterium]